MRRLLLIDDDERLGPPLAAWFKRHDFELEQATRPSAALALLAGGTAYDAAILDVMLPEMDGFELCRTIRKTSSLPIVMLTARGEVMDRVVGLELGADDYLPKPFEPRELLARIQTVLRRTAPAAAAVAAGAAAAAPTLRFEGLEIDLQARAVRCQGRGVELTGTEFELLALLAGAPNRVHSRDDILNRLRGHAAPDIHSRAVDILVSRLRRKLEPLDVIRTLRNAGYLFAAARE
ncbi:MAG: response regulator transcription factor [Burkholderiales bacterium]|nr:response regulator transcription factor [Burkholderiales bacterium]MDE2398860.1 response regulator transcription factor [Burkholderiales bacterium]MDE2455299.1 response regulator transcription factor [Burkholderiales bacterium]